MATSASSEEDKKENWFTRIFRSSSTKNRTIAITNPSFVSFSDILSPRRATENHSKQQQQQQTTIDDSLVDIAVNAGSDISSLADKSRGTIDFFHTPPVSSIFIMNNIINTKQNF
jgi:hypothetical protein